MNTTTQLSNNCGDSLYGIENPQCLVPPFIDFRLNTLEYNEYTYELLIKQNPDVVKRVKIKSGISLEDLSHLNPVLYITTDELPLKIDNNAHIVKEENDGYYYYTWDNKLNKYHTIKLYEGYEFYDLKSKSKYRLENNRLVNLSGDIEFNIEYTESTVVLTNSNGDRITFLPATHSNAGVMSKNDKIKLDKINEYVTKVERILDSSTPNIYLKVIYYDVDLNVTKEETFLLPEVTLSQNGLMPSKYKSIIDNLYESVIKINSNPTTNDEGLTYLYVTKNPYTLQETNHSIKIPVATQNSNGVLSKFDKQILDKFQFIYKDQIISEVYYDGALLTNEKFKVTRDLYNYYIKGNGDTDILIESYDSETGRAGLFTRDIYNNLNTYTNLTPIIEDFRGIKTGEIFEKTSYGEILNKLLYPHLNPVIDFITTDPQENVFEKESEVILNNIRIGITKKSYDINKIEILDNKYNIIYTFSDPSIKDGGIFDLNIAQPLDTINKSEIYYIIKVIDIQNGQTEINTKKFTFIYPYFYGIASDNNVIDFNTLTKLIEPQSNKQIDYTANYEYLIFGYPEYYGNLKIIRDQNGLDVTGFFAKRRISFTTSNTSVPYIFYISNITTAKDFAINFNYNK